MEMHKEFYKGLDEEQLKKMSLEEFAKICKSRSRRAIGRAIKGTNMKFMNFVQRVRKIKQKNPAKIKVGIKTHCREAVIIPEWLNIKFLVYNGKEWKPVEITMEKLGKRLGEYSIPTTFNKHSGPGVGATRGSKFISVK